MSRMNFDRQSQYRTGTAQSGGGVRQSQQPMVNPAMYQSVSRPPLASAANSAPPSSQADVSYRPKTPSQLSQFMGGSPQRPSSSMDSLLNPYGNNSGRQRPYNTMEINPFKDLTSGQQSNQPAFIRPLHTYQQGGASNAQAFMPVSAGGSGQLLAYAGSRYPNSVRVRPEQGNVGSPIVTSSTSIRPYRIFDLERQTNPINYQLELRDPKLESRDPKLEQFRKSFRGYSGPSQNDLRWADKVNDMTGAQLDSLMNPTSSQVPQRAFLPDEGAPPYPQSSAPITSYNTYSNNQYPGYARSDPSQNYSFWRDKVTQLGTAPPNVGELNEGYVSSVENMTGSDLGEHIQRNINKMLDGSGYNEFYPYYGLSKNIPPNYQGNLGGRYRRTRSGVEPIEENSSQISPNQASSLSDSPQRMQAPPPQAVSVPYERDSSSIGGNYLDAVSRLAGGPQEKEGFDLTVDSGMSPPQAVSVPYERGFVGPYSAERALADFNAEAARLNAQPRESFSDFVNQAIEEGVAQGRQQGVTDANKIVDQNLAGSQGFYASPSQRRSGFFTQGMGVLPSDAAAMERQNQPLGDGGPAAAAARADQERRRKEAEGAMQGVPSDGLTRYMPNADLMAFANADRAKEDQQRLQALQDAGIVRRSESGSTGMETTYGREPLKAMTPAEIQFYRHKMNMATNPVYAARINAKREARSADLANQTKTRLEMAANRRQAAADAAGASQQLRNFMAGRGAIGGGQDGFNALMSMAAMQNPNQAFDNYGSAYRAVNEPDMLERRFKMQQDLNDLEVKRQRDSEIRKSQMEILTDPNIPGYQKAQMMQLAQDPTQIGSPEFSSLMRPRFQPDPGKEKIDNYVDAQRYFSQYSVPANEQQAILNQHGLMLDQQDKAEARRRGSLFSDFEGVESLGGFDLGQTEGMKRIQSVPFFAGAGPIANWGVNQFMRMIGMSPADMAERERYRQAGEYNNNTRK